MFDDWVRFHRRHPEVAEQLMELVRQWWRAGRRVGSIELFFNVLRWQRVVAGLPDPTEEYKINNNYKSFYARYLTARADGRLDGFFRFRDSIADEYEDDIRDVVNHEREWRNR